MTRKNGINVHVFCQGLGIRVRPVEALKYSRTSNTIYGGRTVARMISSQGEDHAYRVLRCIQVSSTDAFFGDVIRAIDLYIAAHRTKDASQSLFNEFATIDLVDIRHRARRLSRGMTAQAAAISILIADHLEAHSSPEDKAA